MHETVKKIRVLKVVFDTEIRSYEVPAVRGAIVEKVGRENFYFHNHLTEDTYSYRYPLIQYKMIGHNPAIICVDYGVDEIYKYFIQESWDLRIRDREIKMKVKTLNLDTHEIILNSQLYHYRIDNWVGLSQKNYEVFRNAESLAEKIVMMEHILTGNILSFAKGINWTVPDQIRLKITGLVKEKWVPVKGVKVKAFDLNFKTNLLLPGYIGLGKNISLGFGTISNELAIRN